MPSKVRGGRDGIYRKYGPEFTSRVSVGWVFFFFARLAKFPLYFCTRLYTSLSVFSSHSVAV
jgi:hypothetical protein